MGLKITSAVWNEPHHLYRLFAADGTLLYVGVARDVPDRLRHHAREKEWWPEVVRWTSDRYLNRRFALAAEPGVIQRERPRYNAQYGPVPNRRFEVTSP